LDYNHGYGAIVRNNVGLFYDYFNANYPDLYNSYGPVADIASGSTPNTYDAVLADGVTGVNNTADWSTIYNGSGSATEGVVDFNANHSTNGLLNWSIVSSTVNGSRPLTIHYSNGTSTNVTMNMIVNGGAPSLLTFPPTGAWTTYGTITTSATLTTQNNQVIMQVAYPGATSPVLSALVVSDSVPAAPAVPTGLTYLALTNAPKYDLSAWIKLNWNPVPGATYYDIQRNGLWLAINVPTNSFIDKHVWTSGSAQSYTIIAVNAGGTSSSAITAYSLTGFPISMSATANGPGSVTTTCAASANATSYNVYRATNASGTFTEIAVGVGTSYTDNLAPGGTDYYYMTAYNGLTESLPSSIVSVNVTPLMLAITSEPASQTNSVGGNASFTVGATGYPVLTYQWQAGPPGGPYTNLVNGGNLSGVTNATLSLTAITTNQALSYIVIVTNYQGSITSAPPATLTVNLSPTITNQPASQNVFGGKNASFTVGAVGVAPLSYQWQYGPVGGPYANLGNVGKFSGATSNVLTIAIVTTNQMQAYRVIVSNSYGSVTSSPAALTVQTSLLIDVDIGSTANVQTGAAVLGGGGDIWNGVTTGTSTITDSTGATLSGVGYAVAGYTGFNDQPAGSPHAVMDAATTPLMRDCVYGQNATFTVSLTGLGAYLNNAFNLVVYGSVGDPNQGDHLTLSGATGGNTASTLTTTGASRQISAGIGVAYQTFTGTLTSGTLTITCANNGNTYGGVNGFQLQVIAPAPTVSANANLTSLALNPALSLTPAFASGVLNYSVTEAYGSVPTVTVTNADLTATNQLIYNGTTNQLASGVASTAPALNLSLSTTNVVQVQVTAQDGVTMQTYTVNVIEQPSQTVPKLTNSVSNGTLTLSWPADHLGYRLLMQTNNLSKGVSTNPTDWGTVPGSMSVTTTNLLIIQTNLDEFYRLVYP
jgi:fibronectin type 3 domain-containing protein